MTDNIQDIFSHGELSKTMYARVTTKPYFKGLRSAQNVLPIPQGGARKRFGTEFNAILTETNYTQIYPAVFRFRNECTYVIVLYDDNIAIYLEGNLVATVASTGIDYEEFLKMDHTVLDERFRVSSWYFRPKDLIRSANAANAVTAVNVDPTNTLTVTTALTADIVLPAQFTTTGTLPVTTPQIKTSRTYFIRAITTTQVAIYLTPEDAKADVNRYTITGAGTGTHSLVTLNNWTFSNVAFRNVPTFDFDGGYDSITFTPGATTGATTLTASSAIFSAAFVGGVFIGGEGSARITGYVSTTQVNIDVIDPFSSTAAIQGLLSSLQEPAWSDTRGWPRVCSSFENRAFFANTELLPNGLWGSKINDYDDFDDSETEDNDAISWFPASDTANGIEFITPYKSMIVHTNAGAYSSPMNDSVTITPKGFTLKLQDDTPSSNIQPVSIDNQVFVVNGNEVYSLIWSESILGYQSSVVSTISEHLIKTPVSMAAFNYAAAPGGRYVFIVNADGTLAMYQTLLSEEVSGWTPAALYQDYGDAKFRFVLTDKYSRCWFIAEREIAQAGTTYNITAFSSANNTLTAASSALSTTVPIPVLFAGTTLPTTTPQIVTTKYYWALADSGADVKIYGTQDNALNDNSQFVISSAGTAATMQIFPLTTKLVLEELSYDVKTDCAITENAAARSTLTGLTVFNAQQPVIKGDGVVWDQNAIIGSQVDISIFGVSDTVEYSEVGFNIELEIIPLPESISTGQTIQTSNLARPKHNRSISFLFYNTFGGKINNQDIALKKTRVQAFNPPEETTGWMHITTMSGWDDFMTPQFTITHREPYDFTLLGIFYDVEV